MRTLSLKELHERAIATLEMMNGLELRYSAYKGILAKAHDYWRDADAVRRQELNMEMNLNAYARLTRYYARLIERINAVLTKSLQTA